MRCIALYKDTESETVIFYCRMFDTKFFIGLRINNQLYYILIYNYNIIIHENQNVTETQTQRHAYIHLQKKKTNTLL